MTKLLTVSQVSKSQTLNIFLWFQGHVNFISEMELSRKCEENNIISLIHQSFSLSIYIVFWFSSTQDFFSIQVKKNKTKSKISSTQDFFTFEKKKIDYILYSRFISR